MRRIPRSYARLSSLFTVALTAQFRLRTDSGHDARIIPFIVDGIV